MNPVYEKLQKCYKSVREKTDFEPKVALILGSGLGDYAKNIRIPILRISQYRRCLDMQADLFLDISVRCLWFVCRDVCITMKGIQ